jgi:hypothetical protein
MTLIKRYEPSDNLFKKWGELFAKETLALSHTSFDDVNAFPKHEKNKDSGDGYGSRLPISGRVKLAKKNNTR